MPVPLKDKRTSTLIIVILVGLIIGSYLNSILQMIPGDNVVKLFFTWSTDINVGDFVNNKPVLIDLNAIKLQLGFQLKVSLMSIIGIAVSLYFFRWYK